MRKLLKNEEGTVLEFCLTIPIFLALLLVGLSLIIVGYSKIAVNIATREVARNYAVSAHEYTEQERIDKAKELGCKTFQEVSVVKAARLEKENIVITNDYPIQGYVTAELTAYVPYVAPGMEKIFKGYQVPEGGISNEFPIRGSAVFKEEININN